MGTALRLTAKNQVTLKKEFLLHLGITAGDRIHVSKLPNGELRIRAEKKKPVSDKSLGISPVVWAIRMMFIYLLTSLTKLLPMLGRRQVRKD